MPSPRTRPSARSRAGTAVLAALAVLVGLVVPVTLAAAPAAAAVPTTCTTGRAGDSCSVSAETATSVTVSTSFTYVHRRYDEVSPLPDDWYSLYINGYGGSYTCGPQISGSSVGYFIWSKASPGSLSCSITYTWAPGARPATLQFTVLELRGDAITFLDGTHGATVTFAQPPTANIYADPTPAGPEGSYDFGAWGVNAYGGRTISEYRWSFGDGTTRTTTVPSTTYRYSAGGT